MRTWRTIAWIMLVILVAGCGSSATTTPVLPTDTAVLSTVTPGPLTAERLVDECAEAMGGIAKIEALETIRSAHHWPDHGTIRYEIKRPNLVRMGDSLVFDGERAAWLTGEPVPEEEWKDFEMDIGWYIPAFFDYPAEYLGTEVVDNIETHILQVTLPLGAVMTYNLDAQTYLVYRATSEVAVGDQVYHYERTYSDYRLHDDILYPHAFTYASRDGTEVLTATMETLEFNIPLEDEHFSAPSQPNVASISLNQVSQIEKLHTFGGHSGSVTGLGFLSDGARLASSDVDLALRLWNLQDGQPLHSSDVGEGNSYNAAFSPNGVFWAAESSVAPISIWDVESGQLLHALRGHGGSMTGGLAFSPDGALLATDSNGTIKLWDVESGQEIRVFSGHSSPVGALAFSPDGTLLASGSVEGSTDVKLWDVESGAELHTFTEHTDNVYSLAFSPDGTQLVSASGDRTLKLWDVESGDLIRAFTGHRDRIYSVAFSPDGTLLASGGGEGSIKLWDVESGQEVRTLSGHTDLVRPVSFSPDGSFLASGSFDGTVVVWGIVR